MHPPGVTGTLRGRRWATRIPPRCRLIRSPNRSAPRTPGSPPTGRAPSSPWSSHGSTSGTSANPSCDCCSGSTPAYGARSSCSAARTRPTSQPTEADLLERATSGVAAAIRREMVLTEIAHPHDADGPGLLLLSAALDPLHITPTAQRWLTEIDDGVDPGREIPYGVMTLAARALTSAPPQGSLRSRIRARTGQWLTLHAERLAGDPPQVSIIIEPSRPVEIARLVADAYQLTARERDVVRLLACGYSRHEIARLLTLSPHTVDDHIKRVFGTNSRYAADLSSPTGSSSINTPPASTATYRSAEADGSSASKRQPSDRLFRPRLDTVGPRQDRGVAAPWGRNAEVRCIARPARPGGRDRGRVDRIPNALFVLVALREELRRQIYVRGRRRSAQARDAHTSRRPQFGPDQDCGDAHSTASVIGETEGGLHGPGDRSTCHTDERT